MIPFRTKLYLEIGPFHTTDISCALGAGWRVEIAAELRNSAHLGYPEIVRLSGVLRYFASHFLIELRVGHLKNLCTGIVLKIVQIKVVLNIFFTVGAGGEITRRPGRIKPR